jgi:hypothetical protein
MKPTPRPHQPWGDWPPIRTAGEAGGFLDMAGLCLFARTGATRVPIPALTDVCAEPHEWDTHPMVWKDELHEAGRAYYGTLVRGRTSLIVPELLPAFFRLQGVSGAAYLAAHDRGVLDPPPLRVLWALLNEGPLTTTELRRAAGLTGPHEKPPFTAATHALMQTLTVTIVRATSRQLAGYRYVWDVFDRVHPEVGEAAVVRYPDPADAIQAVAERCRAWLDAATDAAALFGWQQIASPMQTSPT